VTDECAGVVRSGGGEEGGSGRLSTWELERACAGDGVGGGGTSYDRSREGVIGEE
jgi:hypothetical protein